MLRLVLVDVSLSFDQIILIIGLVVNIIQALVLPITIYLLAVQTRSMRQQTTALLVQSKEMTEQTRVFTDTIYSATFQSLYDAEAHIGELMMTYPEASRILMSQVVQGVEVEKTLLDTQIDPALRERVSWLGTAMLDFFEHIWTQAQKRGLPEDTWESWEEYMGKIISETRLRLVWQTERGYYSPGFRHFVDLKVGFSPDIPSMPPLPRPQPENPVSAETIPPQVARVIRAVTEETKISDASESAKNAVLERKAALAKRVVAVRKVTIEKRKCRREKELRSKKRYRGEKDLRSEKSRSREKGHSKEKSQSE